MHKPDSSRIAKRQSGVALATSLIFLLVVTIIALMAANNSALNLKMAASMQDTFRSFQAAEAGVYAVLGLTGTAADPFRRQAEVLDPFADVSPHPLQSLADDPDDPDSAISIVTSTALVSMQRSCKRPPREGGGTSIFIIDCDYYRVDSEHNQPGRARTRVEIGVAREVIGGG